MESAPRILKHTRGALGPGADVWFIPSQSQWSSKIDWHLNFQFSRIGRKRKRRRVPVSVVSEKIFPAQQIIQLPPLKPAHWVNKVFDLWQSLGQLRARVFLPANLNADEFKQHLNACPGATSYAEIHLIDLIED